MVKTGTLAAVGTLLGFALTTLVAWHWHTFVYMPLCHGPNHVDPCGPLPLWGGRGLVVLFLLSYLSFVGWLEVRHAANGGTHEPAE